MLQIDLEGVVPGGHWKNLPVSELRVVFHLLPLGPDLEGIDQRTTFDRHGIVEPVEETNGHRQAQRDRFGSSPRSWDIEIPTWFPDRGLHRIDTDRRALG